LQNKSKKNFNKIVFITAAAVLLFAGCGASPAEDRQTTLPQTVIEDINKLQNTVFEAEKDMLADENMPLKTEPQVPDTDNDISAEPEAMPQEIITPLSPKKKESLLKCNFFDEQMFNGHMIGSVAAAELLDMQEGLKAAIIPHHLTAGDYITAVFEQAAKEDFETVVFLAPNHTGQGGDVVYSASDWQTPFGKLACDQELTEFLMRDKQIKGSSNDKRMQEDHAISGLIPYLARFMPEVKTVSILLSGSIELAKVSYLAEQLAKSEKDILLICSVDFSHYLQYNEAAQKDKETIEAIENANFPVIANFHNDHFDSAPCITAFLTYAKTLGLTHKLHWNGTSSELVGYGPEKYIEGGITTYQIWMLNEK